MKKTTNICQTAIVIMAMAVFLVSWQSLAAVPAAAGGLTAGGRFAVITADTATQDTVDNMAETAWPENVRSRIDALLASDMFRTSTVGMMIYDITADSVIFKYNESQLMRPASTLKMMVAVAALDRLGGDYRYATELLYDGRIEGCVLDGDLYCRGGFDPAFGRDDLAAFADSVKALGIDTVRGNLYADLSMKDSDRLGEGWCWDDDNPVLTPLLISGKDEFLERFKDALNRVDIVVEGSLKEDRVPRGAVPLCVIRRPIDDILPRMMKESDNLYSESLFYQLAASAGSSAPATAKQGRRMMNRLIERLGFRPSDYYIADGSGLSLYNYVSPELEVAFLRYAYSKTAIHAHLYDALPIAGVDGTLDSRMRHGYANGNVRAKTGTVTGVSSLAGYCMAANGHVLCFSIINMGIRRAAIGRHFQDRVCEALCRP